MSGENKKEKKIDDLMSIFDAEIPKDNTDDLELKRADLNVEAELEQEKELAEARKLFESGELSFGEFVDDEGEIRVGIYTKNSKSTPLNKLMEMCEADLPYQDDDTVKDYKSYVEDYGIEEVEYDPIKARKKKLDDLI